MVITPTLPLAVERHHKLLLHQGSITPIAFKFPKSGAAIPAVKLGHRGAIAELFRNNGTPITNLLLTVLVKGTFSGPSKCGQVDLYLLW